MIQIHKWYPFVFPKEYDVRAIAHERRAQRLEAEQLEAEKAQKVRNVVDAYDLELYNKRASQHSIELEMFNDRKRFDKFA